MKLTVDILSINVLILEYNDLYKCLANKNRIRNNNNEKINPIMILKYTTIKYNTSSKCLNFLLVINFDRKELMLENNLI